MRFSYVKKMTGKKDRFHPNPTSPQRRLSVPECLNCGSGGKGEKRRNSSRSQLKFHPILKRWERRRLLSEKLVSLLASFVKRSMSALVLSALMGRRRQAARAAPPTCLTLWQRKSSCAFGVISLLAVIGFRLPLGQFSR